MPRASGFLAPTLQAVRGRVETCGLAPEWLNQKLSAVTKLAPEASYAGLLDSGAAQAIREVKNARQKGVKTGTWLTKAQAESITRAPDRSTLKGRRDRAMLAVLIGCGLGRDKPPG